MKKKTIKHITLDFFPVHDGMLFAAGESIENIIAMTGETPLYIYDRQLINERICKLRSILPAKIKLHYALKANPMPAVVHYLSGLVDGLDIASQGEMLTALNTGMHRSEISFAGPGKTDQELTAAIAAKIVINVESARELERIDTLARKLNLIPNIALRINPDFELKTSGMKMSGGPKPFGIDAELIPAVLEKLEHLNMNFEGLHIFSGSQNLNHEAIIDAHNKTFELAAKLTRSVKIDFRFINIGGGFGIPYFPGDQPLKLQPVADNLQLLLDTYSEFSDKQIVIELGRYLVGEAGIYVSRIIDKKESRGTTYLVTDGGLHHHLSNSGNFGQLIRKNYPVIISKKIKAEKQEVVNIVGPLCTPLDVLANKMELPEADIGDLVVILQSGAYGKTASPEKFLGHPAVKELLL